MVHHPFSRISPFFAADRPTSADSDIGVLSLDAGANDKTSCIFAGLDGIQRIDFAASGERARKIISRSNSRPTGSFASMRMNRMIHWDSPHELNAYRLLESNPEVLQFSEQPCVIHYRLGGTDYRHYPDSLLKTASSKVLWEVKTASDARRAEVADRTRLLTHHLPAHGYQYAVVLAEDLRREPRLRNVRLLLRQGRQALTFAQKEYVRRLFCDADFLYWKDILDGRCAPLTVQQACRLVLDNLLHFNLDEELGSNTMLCKVPRASLFGSGHV